MEFEESQLGIVQVHLQGSDQVVGTGFLLLPGYILTCAHVVREALPRSLTPEGADLEVTFFEEASKRCCRVVAYNFQPDICGLDAAVLELLDCEDLDISIPPFAAMERFKGVTLRGFGYPEVEGRGLSLESEVQIKGGWVQVRTPEETGLEIEGGFSGSPVWCNERRAWMGMVVARDDRRSGTRVGFILPKEQLSRAFGAVKQHALQKLLGPFVQTLSQEIQEAYSLCRKNRRVPHASSWIAILDELNESSAGGAQNDPLVCFVACLLNKPTCPSELCSQLEAWASHYTQDLQALRDEMLQEERSKGDTKVPAVKPCLMVSVQADVNTQAAPYQVSAWLLKNPSLYDADKGVGAELLSNQGWENYAEEPDKIDKAAGLQYEDLNLLLAAYLDQVGAQGIALEDLSVEIFLPLKFMNDRIEALEIPSEGGLGFPEFLGITEQRPHVVIRSQKRLSLNRSEGIWKRKWQQFLEAGEQRAQEVFEPNTTDLRALQARLKTALALKIESVPTTANRGELALLLNTGTPAAIWSRIPSSESCNFNNQVSEKVLDGAVKECPDKVLSLRRETPALEDDTEVEQSLALGHHMAFLWEDPQRVPPRIIYQSEAS